MKKMLTNNEISLICLCCKSQIKNDEDFYDIVGCIFCKRCVDSSFKKHFDANTVQIVAIVENRNNKFAEILAFALKALSISL